MQTYLLALAAAQPFTAYQARGDLFVYESGEVSTDPADRRIVVKPDSGGEITLRPGQRFRLAPGEMASTWAVRTLDNSVTLNGSIIIGSGEFDDANTLNTFKLDGEFANNVTVNNTPDNRVPVALDPDATISTRQPTVNYTNAWADVSLPPASQMKVLTAVTPAQNPNGLYVELVEFSMASNGSSSSPPVLTLIAKDSEPTTEKDGDVLMVTGVAPGASGVVTTAYVNDRLPYRIKVAAGKGLYVLSSSVPAVYLAHCRKTILTTIL